MFLWTEDEINKILIQLEARGLPFKKYTFSRDGGGGLVLLGTGGFARVYGVRDRKGRECALKVIGFSEKRVESECFRQSVQRQNLLGIAENHIVHIYGSAELQVYLDDGNRVTDVRPADEGQWDGCLRLQFILMEKLRPVVTHSAAGKLRLYPDALAQFDEREILNLAYDIGSALTAAHQDSILHRDVKLENIFYSDRKKCYKLGDFGIAKFTEDGMASTMTFTKGYGAPEVTVSADAKYDCTADIYSFGILLYVLLNRLRFPGSNTYSANLKEQYGRGYVIPRPAGISDAFFAILEKMCRYDPDDRYQSADELLRDLEELLFGAEVSYQKKHRKAMLVVGLVALLAAAIPAAVAPGLYAGDRRWIEVSCFLLAFVLLTYFCMSYQNDKKMMEMYLKQQRFWLIVMLFFLMLLIWGWLLEEYPDACRLFFGREILDLLISLKLKYVGLAGTAFGLLWLVRSRILMFAGRRRKKE